MNWGACGQHVADGERREERAEQVRAAALVLLLAGLPVLVAADRDVLCTVVRGEIVAPQSEHRRDERGDGPDELLRSR
jgi:hypothetical protein